MKRIMSLSEVDQWIEKQSNDRDYTIRKRIPGYEAFRLEIGSKLKQRKSIRLYWNDNGKVSYPLLGIYPYVKFEEAFRKFADFAGNKDRAEKPRAIRLFKDIWIEFVNENPLSFKQKTIDSYRKRTNRHILSTSIADMDIADITLDDLKIEIFSKNKKQPATNVKLFYILRNILKFATEKGYLKNDILENFVFSDSYEAPCKTNTQSHSKIVNKLDLKNFLESVSNAKISVKKKILIFFALETALRSMNLFDLKWKDIDFEKNRIYIGKERMKGELRTEKSRQDFILPLSNTMISLLMRLRELEKIKNSDLKKRVFDGIGDQPMNDLLRKLAGITKHGLRGTFKTHVMKGIKDHRTPNFIIEMYMSHIPDMTKVEASYFEANYKDDENQKMMRELAEWWNDYLLKLFDFKKILLNEGENDALSL
nr:tyrosine-type recombinase/integrase [uncultured Campylobacter sp.]